MHPRIADALAILERTPAVLDALLRDLPEEWTTCREGDDTWSAFDVVGHLIHGERTDWIPRIRVVLEEGENGTFEPFDRFAQEREQRGRALDELLDDFAELRRANVETLRDLGLESGDFSRRARHPELGPVTLGELLSTWVVHDLGHLGQIARVMAKRCGDRVGPWAAYLPILDDRT